jgi:hypothetical protein
MSRGLFRRRLAATGGVLLAVLAGATALYAAGFAAPSRVRPLTLTAAEGAIGIGSSRAGGAIFRLANLGPGMSGEGEVTIGNTGSLAGSLALVSFAPSDAPGLYGGALSARIDLRIADVSAGGHRQVYAGALDSMPRLELGVLAAGASRTYRFLVSMRDGGAPSSPYLEDNLYQRAGTSLGYEWSLTETEAGGEEPQAPPPTSTVPPSGAAPAPDEWPHDRLQVGNRHPNLLLGSPQNDLIYGRGGADVIRGMGGRDYLLGGAGADRVSGGPGADRIRGGIGSDQIHGGSGADVVFARDRSADLVDCGSGADIAYVDVHDRTVGCEIIRHRYGRLFDSRPSGR